jgi:hypothetical protein
MSGCNSFNIGSKLFLKKDISTEPGKALVLLYSLMVSSIVIAIVFQLYVKLMVLLILLGLKLLKNKLMIARR